ncbi:MAG: hypothetical protein HKN10_16055 [Myxococcales bacterium]|nr:hypothetical protein [Myxococcales bacterium]
MTASTSPTGRLRKFIPQPHRYAELYGNFTLTPRDLEILATVHSYRYLEARHIRALVAGSDQQITRRLQGLFHNRYVGRFLPPQRMRLDLDQGAPLIAYGLELAGARALAATGPAVARPNGSERNTVNWNKAHTRRTEWFLRHSLMLSNFRCVLELATRADAETDFSSWEQGVLRKGTRIATDGRMRPVRVAPDGYFALRRADKTRHCFLEIDRATEELDRLMAKYVNYWWYLQSPEFRSSVDRADRAIVLFVTIGPQRLTNMMATLRDLRKPNRSQHGGKGLFWFCLESEYSINEVASVFGAIWQTIGSGSERYKPL